jgi:purine-binding chemotaxis protein CheW
MSTATFESKVVGHNLAGKYLIFTLHQQSYALAVLKIREIIRLTNITAVPQMPAFVCGVINLRGKIIPVMDLGLRFGFAQAERTGQTCLMVVQVKGRDGRDIHMGLVVDGVEEVVNLAATDIEATPDFGTNISTEFILGMAKLKDGVKTLLDIDQLVGSAGDAFPIAASRPLPHPNEFKHLDDNL